jgi:prepilin-type N-terminal cleavage/methylation domain-containing protein
MDFTMFAPINRALDARLKGIKDEEKGFTLIELLVVVIIIGILAAIAIPVYLGIQNNAKDSAVKSDVGNLKTALVAYGTDHNGDMSGASVTTLGTYGYAGASAATNYGTAPAYTLAASPAVGFCVTAVSVTGTKVVASDNSGVVSSGTAACAVATTAAGSTTITP